MDLCSISSEDGDKAVFFNGVLIAYYNAATDEPNVLSFVESVADNLSSASGANIKKAKIDKAPDFVHWEQSKQVENILWPNKTAKPPISDLFSPIELSSQP